MIFIVLDNAEFVLDPRRMSAQEIYAMVEELSQLNNICPLYNLLEIPMMRHGCWLPRASMHS